MNIMNIENVFLHRLYRRCYVCKHLQLTYSTQENLKYVCKYLKIDESKGQYLQLKHPGFKNLSHEKIKDLVGALYNLGYPRDILVQEPSLCGVLPITLKYRYAVLQECGFYNILVHHLTSYLKLVRQKKISELKANGLIPLNLNLDNKLASCMTQWPTSLTTLVYGDVNEYTLYALRMKIIQRYLELILDLSPEEFARGIETYPTIKHRPLQVISETLNLLQNEILMPKNKIKSNMYLIHADPNNLKNIIYNLKSIGGINIKDILRMHPKLAMVNYSTMIETQRILKEYNVAKEAQARCLQIYTLSPTTIRERLEKAKSIPEFNTFFSHPRFLKMIFYNNTALKRLMKLYSNNKKCLSLNILSGSTAHYEIFEKAPGDRLGKGKDLIFCISKSLGNKYSMSEIRKIIRKHPFWINIPLVQVKYVYEQLSLDYSTDDIYQNCFILLYPWNKIREMSILLNKKQYFNKWFILEQVDLTKLKSTQKLSLILYLLERSHYFSGNGVWSDEKCKNTGERIENAEISYCKK